MKSKHRWKGFAAVLTLVVFVIVIGWEVLRSRNEVQDARSGGDAARAAGKVPAAGRTPVAAVDDALVQQAFRTWMQRFENAPPERRVALLPEGRAVLEQRRVRLARLIRQDPRQALKESLKLHEYEMMPAELRGLVEKPFSAEASYNYYPVCGAPAGMPDHLAVLSLEGGRFDAFTFGRRTDVMSKTSLPTQGITLDGVAAMDDSALRRLDAAELATARRLFPAGQKDAARSFLTGKLLVLDPVVALGGGRLYHLANEAELTQINFVLAKLDQLPGPSAGSDVLYQAMAANGSGGFDLQAAQASEQMQASQWTETEKKVFIIRADFSDVPGLSHSQAVTAASLSLASDQIRAMSYGKTWVTAAVSENVYRMPQTAAFYVNAGASFNYELLRDARNTFRNTRFSGDATIDIGPVNNNATGNGGGLGAYHIVGVLFGGIGMTSSFAYAGLAGGSDLWMQDTTGTGTFTHEFGHNYGIGHSGFWQTSDGSVLGAGANNEYGDDYDIMGRGGLPKGHFHAQAKAKLDWLSANEWSDASVGGSATYRVHRIDSQFTTGTPRGVRITRSAVAGNEEYLWLNYRPQYAGMPFFERGTCLMWQRPGQTRCSLVDATPATSGLKSDAPIPLGMTFADAASNAFVTPLAAGGVNENSWLDVRVNFGPFPGNTAPTAGSISGPSTVLARSTRTYSVAANDANGDALAYSWITGDGSVPDTAPSISQNWTVGGSYTLNLTVSDMKGGTIPLTKAVTVTDPLDTWTAGSVGSSESLNQLVYAKGRFVSAEYFGTVFLSWDGVTWSNVGDPPDIDQPKLAYGAGVFVAAGIKESANTTAQITWSADGRRWNQASFPNGVPVVKMLSFGGGQFVALGDDGLVLHSADGKTWTVNTVGSLQDFRRLTWTGGAWVASAVNPATAKLDLIWTSPDGVTWTQRSALGFDVYQLSAHDGSCYAIGWYGGVSYSTNDGVTWAAAQLPEGTRWTTYLMAAAADGTLLCTAWAMDEPGTAYALLVSTDGRRWVRASGNSAVVNASALVWGDGRFVTAESGGIIRRSDSFYPTNSAPSVSLTTSPATAKARQPVYLAASANDSDGAALTYAWDFGAQSDVQDGLEIAPTFSFGGTYNLTLRVSDGRGGMAVRNHTLTITDPARSFTQRSSGTTETLQSIASNDTTLVVVGNGGTILTSNDGQIWTSRSVPESVVNIYFYGVTWDGSQFVVVGEDYHFGIGGWVSLIYTSPTGTNWTRRHFGGTSGTALYAVAASSSGVMVACGQGGTVLRSTDGITWGPISGFGTSLIEAVARNASRFVLTGHSSAGSGTPKVWTSTDGQSWIDTTSGSGLASWQDMRHIAWLNDRFVSSGWYSKLRSSTNDGSTFTTTRSDYERAPAMAYGGGVYFAAGINYNASEADLDLLSLDGTDWFAYAAPTTANRASAVFFNNTFITVGAAGSIWQSDALTGASGFAQWQNLHFPGAGIPALADRDPDGDGLKNLVEYALNLAPFTPNAAPGYPLQDRGRLWLHLDIPQPAPADVRYLIQGSTSLGATASWSEIARKTGAGAWSWAGGGTSRILTGVVSGGKIPTEISVPDSQASQPRYFMRLVIEQL